MAFSGSLEFRGDDEREIGLIDYLQSLVREPIKLPSETEWAEFKGVMFG